ncbi:hypothetical protein DM02DRAFT_602382 [Periconia macrospinosa]|uniref:DUF7703 domain-containing protein n=1 Tax=Periconia macrospinosa TaxID=97972 RepID=A0A2V1DAE0_9PLEO|nr:hypothetical protein DM02DRAFT_602382 [Periconia macrospinosa]
MVNFNIPDIKKDLPMSMTMAAFSGIAWYTSVELNLRFFYLFKRRKGVYFWSCVVCSWGIFLHPLAILLADFQVIQDTRIGIPLIYITWWIMTMAFSVVMWSRLHLIMPNTKYLRWVLYMIIFTTLFISIPSMVIGPMSQQPTPSGKRLVPFYNIWGKIENATWPIQETVMALLYIWYTHKNLRISSRAPPSDLSNTSSNPTATITSSEYSADSYSKRFTQLLHHLIATNVMIIVLDAVLLGIVYAEMWYLQGNMKPAVYGVKLRIEFSILNRLVTLTQAGRNPIGSSPAAPPSFITKAGVAGGERAENA